MQVVIHECRGVRYNDDIQELGFSGRAAYAMGLDKPNYHVPALQNNGVSADHQIGR